MNEVLDGKNMIIKIATNSITILLLIINGDVPVYINLLYTGKKTYNSRFMHNNWLYFVLHVENGIGMTKEVYFQANTNENVSHPLDYYSIPCEKKKKSREKKLLGYSFLYNFTREKKSVFKKV